MKPTSRIILILTAFILHSCEKQEKHEISSPTATEAFAAEETTVTAKTDIAKFQSVTSIVGEPKAIWWAGEAMGTPGNDRVPGPTDIFLRAVIDYGSADLVAQMLNTVDGKSERVKGASWYPERLINSATDKDGFIRVKEYKNVPGFHPDALIRVPDGIPSYIILAQILG